MSYDGDDRRDRRRRDRSRDNDRSRDRRNRSPVYEEEEIIRARRGPKASGGTRRRDNSSSSGSSVEEVHRSFPPGGGGYDRRRNDDYYDSRRRRDRDARRVRDDRSDYDDRRRDDRYDYDRRRDDFDRRRRRSSSSYSSRSPPRRERHKSLGEQALAALGIGGAAGAAAASRSKSRDRKDRRSRRYSDSSSSRSRSRGRGKKGGDPRDKVLQAARAAVIAGGAEAWRMRKEPGGWGGPKGRRVLTAAVGAAGIDGLLDKDPNKGGVKHTIEAVIGGLAGNRLLNGSRHDEEVRAGDSRSQSRGREGIAGLSAGAGALAASAANAFNNRTKNNGGRRDYSSSSEDSRRGGRRNKPVSDYLRRGMGALGLGGNKGSRRIDERNRSRSQSSASGELRPFAPLSRQNPQYPSQQQYPNEDYNPQYASGGQHPNGQFAYGKGGQIAQAMHGQADPSHVPRPTSHGEMVTHLNSDNEESVSSTEEERERKQMGHKQMITAGLASVATIHAAHTIYQSMQISKVRKKEVKEGGMSKSEARKRKHKRQLQSAATLGIAALGVKGAYSEWKEMKEQRAEVHEFDLNRARRKERRLVLSEYGLSNAPTSQLHASSVATPQSSRLHVPHGPPSVVNDPDQYYAQQPGPRYGDVPYYAPEGPIGTAQGHDT